MLDNAPYTDSYTKKEVFLEFYQQFWQYFEPG